MTAQVPEMVAAGISLAEAERAFRCAYCVEALKQSHGNQCSASELIAVHRNTFMRIVPSKERKKFCKGKQYRKHVPTVKRYKLYVFEQPSYLEQESRMTLEARQVMRNELKRVNQNAKGGRRRPEQGRSASRPINPREI